MSEELLSALLDGECTPGELKRLLEAVGKTPALEERWSRMCLVREAMEGTRVRKAAPDFCAGVMAAIASETAPAARPEKVVDLAARRAAPKPVVAAGRPAAAVRTRRWQPVTGLAAAASIAAVVAVGGYRVLNQPLSGQPAAAGNPAVAEAASTTTAVAPQEVAAVSADQGGLVPVSTSGQVGHWSGSGLDAATARQLDEFLLEHSNMRAAQGMGGALFYPRMAVRTAAYRPGEPR
jgi:negative regulator of sigma E activity